MRTQYSIISWLFVAIVGCGNDVPGTNQTKLQPAIKPESTQAVQNQKSVEMAKGDKAETAAATSAILAQIGRAHV